VKNFLALARQRPPERQRVQLNQVVREAVELLAYPLRVDTVEVCWDLAEDLPLLWADPHQLQQVMVNLITNAQQAMCEMPLPHRLSITTRFEPLLGWVSLAVADTGPGIPPEIQGRIFEPFFTTKPIGAGTGLGLSLCQGIIESHNGRIRAESSPGQGAVFVVELPMMTPPVCETGASSPTGRPPERGKAILVVDDEPEVAEVLADMLAQDGHRVARASNGVEALAKVQEQRYDVIFGDLRMPELDGPGLYQALEEHQPELCRRVIFLTGDTLSPEIHAFVERTGVPTVSKPFDWEEIQRAIRQVLLTHSC